MKKLVLGLALLALVGCSQPRGPGAAGPNVYDVPLTNSGAGNLRVSAWVDKDPGGQESARYQEGDLLRASVQVSADAYVYLFNVGTAGDVNLMLPNHAASGGNLLKAGVPKTLPAQDDPFFFKAACPCGANTVFALASTTPLALDPVATFEQGNIFAKASVNSGPELASALRSVLGGQPANTWATDAARYTVGQP